MLTTPHGCRTAIELARIVHEGCGRWAYDLHLTGGMCRRRGGKRVCGACVGDLRLEERARLTDAEMPRWEAEAPPEVGDVIAFPGGVYRVVSRSVPRLTGTEMPAEAI